MKREIFLEKRVEYLEKQIEALQFINEHGKNYVWAFTEGARYNPYGEDGYAIIAKFVNQDGILEERKLDGDFKYYPVSFCQGKYIEIFLLNEKEAKCTLSRVYKFEDYQFHEVGILEYVRKFPERKTEYDNMEDLCNALKERV